MKLISTHGKIKLCAPQSGSCLNPYASIGFHPIVPDQPFFHMQDHKRVYNLWHDRIYGFQDGDITSIQLKYYRERRNEIT